MSADGPAPASVEVGTSSDGLDLNADAMAVDNQEDARVTDTDDSKAVILKTSTEPSSGAEAIADESGGRTPCGDGDREIMAKAVDADFFSRRETDVVISGGEAVVGTVSTCGVAEFQRDESNRLAEANASRSMGTEGPNEKTEIAPEHFDRGRDSNEPSSVAISKSFDGEKEVKVKCVDETEVAEQPFLGSIIEGGTRPDGDNSPVEVVHAAQETSEKVNERDDSLHATILSVIQPVESEDTCPKPIADDQGDQGGNAVAGANIIPDTENAESRGEDVHISGESAEKYSYNFVGNFTPEPGTFLLSTHLTSEVPSHVDIPTDLENSDQEMRKEIKDSSEKPHNKGDSQVSVLADKLVHLGQDGGTASVMCGPNTSQEARSGIFISSTDKKPENGTTFASFDVSVCPDEEDSLANSSACWVLNDNSSEVQHVGSFSGENPDLQPNVVIDKDVSANLEIEKRHVVKDIFPIKEMPGQEVKPENEEADGVIITVDVTEDRGGEVDTDDEVREPNMIEAFGKSYAVNSDPDDPENKPHLSYILPQEDEEDFSISDLVWGKVKSHPWWPGQIFDPLDASEMALKHQKRDNFLVAYFGDKTFAWCDGSKLKPFRGYFTQLTEQSTYDAFVYAVNSALVEVSRRLELGMSCVCVSDEVINKLKHQKFENAGIREECYSFVDKTYNMSTFAADNFLDYVKALAICPCIGVDRLELVIARAQSMAFNRLKCRMEFPAFVGREGLLENDSIASLSHGKRSHKGTSGLPSPSSTEEETVIADLAIGKQRKSPGRELHKQNYIPEHGRKRKSLSELMDEKNYVNLLNNDEAITEMGSFGKAAAYSSGKKHKLDDSSIHTLKSKTKRLDALGDIEKKTPASDKSFKVGECISRIASKLTGSLSIIKCNGENLKKGDTGIGEPSGQQVFDLSVHTPEDTRNMRKGRLKNDSSPQEILSQLCSAARDPMKEYNFLSSIICFFTEVRELRDSGSLVDKRFEKIKKKRGRKRKSEINDDSNGRPSSSGPATDEKLPEKIGKKRGRKKKSEVNIDAMTDKLEDSKPDYMADSYWTDRIMCDTPEEKSHSGHRKRRGHLLGQMETKRSRPSQESLPLSKMLEAADHLRICAVSPTKNRDSPFEKQPTFFGDKCLEESSPTALVLFFNDPDALPSEASLIRTFSCYGPLKQAETEVLRETNSAQVVFKRHADAEVAFRSAGKYCIFGPALVSYRLRHLSSLAGASSDALSDGRKDMNVLNDVGLKIPVQEETTNQEESKELAKQETKEPAQHVVNECIDAEVKEIVGDSLRESDGVVVKEITEEDGKRSTQQEAKDIAQHELEKLVTDENLCKEEVKGLAQNDAKELDKEEANELGQNELQELYLEVGLAQNDVKELDKDKAKELGQNELQVLDQEDVKELCQDIKDLGQNGEGLDEKEANRLAQHEMELDQDEAMKLCVDEVKDLTQEVRKSAQAEKGGLSPMEVKELAENELNQYEAKKLCQAEDKELAEDEATASMQEEVTSLMQEESTKLLQEGSTEILQEEVTELIQEEVEESTQSVAKES